MSNEQPTLAEVKAAWRDAIFAEVDGVRTELCETLSRLREVYNKKITWIGDDENALRKRLNEYLSLREDEMDIEHTMTVDVEVTVGGVTATHEVVVTYIYYPRIPESSDSPEKPAMVDINTTDGDISFSPKQYDELERIVLERHENNLPEDV